MTEQTRSTRRIASNHPLQLRYSDWNDFVRAYARDVSTGGMFVATEEAPAILSFLDIEVTSPSGEAISLNARVVHIVTREQVGPNGTPGIGVEFQNVTAETRARLQAWIQRDSQRPPRSTSGVQDVRPSSPPRNPSSSQSMHAAVISAPAAEPTAFSAKEEKATVLRLTAELQAIGQKTDFEILGVDQSVSEAGVRAAFVAQSRLYHPDLYAQYATPEIRQIATQIFVRIKRAFTQLMTRVQQRDPGAAAANLARALGTSATTTTAQRTALTGFAPSASDSGSITSLIAEARRHVAHKRYEEAQRSLEKALLIDPNHREVKIWFYTVRARRLKLRDEVESALEHYRLVLELDEKNLEAIKELRAFERPSLFSALKAKKD